jgi:phosphoglycolate phosphatase-like HAD superfamily hydrolase
VLTSRRYRANGDVHGCVAALRARGAVVGLATGNLREGARHKLTSAGIEGCFDLALGGYGGDAELRAEIVRTAARRCGATDGDDVVVVGDTEFDVLAARAAGARCVGVAISAAARTELEHTKIPAIVDDCGDALVEAVLGEPPVG